MSKKLTLQHIFVCLSFVYLMTGATFAQTTPFSYQGKLINAGNPANAPYDMQFTLFDAVMGGVQIGSLTQTAVQVTNGIFTVQLDFGVSAFSGADRFLEISVRPAGGGTFTTLAPRQQIGWTPYSIRTLSAAAADALSSACAGCVQDAQINSVAGSKVNGTIPVASVPAGSDNYIQNTMTPQAGANFNISGDGLVGGNVGIGTTAPEQKLQVNGITSLGAPGSVYGYLVDGGFPGRYPTLGFNTYGTSYLAGVAGYGGIFQFQDGDGSLIYYTGSNVAAGQPHASAARFTIDGGGNVGIGDIFTFTPQHRLDIRGGPLWTSNFWSGAIALNNGSAMGWRANAGGQRFGIGQSTGGLYFFRTASDPGSTTCAMPPCPANYDVEISDSGNVGIGIAPSAGIKLDVNGNTLIRTSGSGGHIQFGTPAAETGMTVIGTNRADVRFDGSTLKLLAGTSTGIPASTNGIAINTAGNVGIGTPTPRAKLQIVGDAVQDIGNNGLVKAMALVTASNTTLRCYNSTKTGSEVSTPPCGFQNLIAPSGARQIDFGFQVDNRFVSVTANQGDGSTASFKFTNFPTSLTVHTTPSNAPFMIIVY